MDVFISKWQRGGGDTLTKLFPAREAQWAPLPDDIHPALEDNLERQSVTRLYSHQAEALKLAGQGRNVAVVTGVASGKTLCYNLPVLQRLLREPDARALYLFPTKALAQDQLAQFESLADGLDIPIAVYDGDTTADRRPAIRERARVVVSNPDMLHAGLLPHHARWVGLLAHLRYIVIDEIHSYRGVFGSHVVNVLRRLRRVARFYGADPQFICTSATIANPGEHAAQLIGAPVETVQGDGAPRGARHFMLYNPPVVNAELGIRRSSTLEAVRATRELISRSLQTIVFALSRPGVERILSYLRAETGLGERIRGYRSGYLPQQRREIERGLRDGEIDAVVATNALEAGIDIGGLDAAVLVGYPGSIASLWQQAGRAGRRDRASLTLMICGARPLDQFLFAHPEYLFGRSPEQALVNPDHLLILFQHVACAAFELPFRKGESLGDVDSDTLDGILEVLQEQGEVHASGDRRFWMSERYPAADVSLRNASPDVYLLNVDHPDGHSETIGKVDSGSAFWMVHPQAVYIHEGESYLVTRLDLEQRVAHLSPRQTDYYTEATRSTEVKLLERQLDEPAGAARRSYGDIEAITQVTGFRKVKWRTHEVLGNAQLELPASHNATQGYWFSLTPKTVAKLQAEGFDLGAANDYGPDWPQLAAAIRRRDGNKCVHCGAPERGRAHDVHHVIPFRQFSDARLANRPENLRTLCPSCHKRAEAQVRMQSGLSGVAHVLRHLAPLFLLCDVGDIGVHSEARSPLADGQPAVTVYDYAPGGLGLSRRLYDLHEHLIADALALTAACPCKDGCPSCTGPAPEGGAGGKQEAMAILREVESRK